MSVELTPYNVDTVLGVYPERLYRVVPDVLEQLLNPHIDMMTLYTYCKAFHDRLEQDRRPDGHMGFDSFGEACFEGGIVKTFLKIARDPKNHRDQTPGLTAHFALQTFWVLMKTGTLEERRELLKELYNEGVVDLCLDNALNAPLAIHRHSSVNFIRCLSSESFLGEFVSAAETSRIIIQMCKYISSSPQLFIKQFGDARLTWQSMLCFGKLGTPRDKAAKYAPRYFAMSQESAAWTIQGLFIRCPPPSPSFCLEILKQDPNIIDHLFKAAATKRPPWYAELAVDSIICESIVMLFRVPEMIIPGVDTTIPNDGLQQERTEEWATVLECLQILVGRPNWVEMLHGVWNMIEDEQPHEVRLQLKNSRLDYHAQSEYDLETFLQVFEYRGSCHICMERLIASLSYLSDREKLKDEDLLSLLRISNAGVRTQPASLQQAMQREADQFIFLESGFELFRKPLYSVFTEDEVDYPLQVANETYMGPIAHARLLTVLSERKILSNLPQASEVPKSVGSRISILQLRTIGTPDAIRTFLRTAKPRVTKRKAEGTKRFKEDGEMDYACAAYYSAAELAKSLISFDKATHGQYSTELQGIRREYVMCLGNAAEMALGQELFERALFYASAAVNATKDLPLGGGADAVDASIREKNERRVARAQVGLLSKS